MFIAVLLTIAKAWKQPKCPSTEEWIKKIGDIYIYTYIYIYIYICRLHTYTYLCVYIDYVAIEKNEIMLFTATWIDLEMIILSEVSQKDKHRMKSLICRI